jgi:hypothetical protein
MGRKSFAREHAMGYGFLAGVPIVDVPVPTDPTAGCDPGAPGATGVSGFPGGGKFVPGG